MMRMMQENAKEAENKKEATTLREQLPVCR